MNIRPEACIARLMKLLLRDGRRSREDAEDLVQEAYLRMEEYSRTMEVRSREDFLVRTARNLEINQYRRNALVAFESVEQLAGSREPTDPCADLERQLDAEQRLEKIRRVLDAASRRTREIYFAHRGGYHYREIAAAFGIGERTVEKHIARAVFLLMQAKELPRRDPLEE